jgi:hypothetical protein
MAEGYPQGGCQALFSPNGLKRTLERPRMNGVHERRHAEKTLLLKFEKQETEVAELTNDPFGP